MASTTRPVFSASRDRKSQGRDALPTIRINQGTPKSRERTQVTPDQLDNESENVTVPTTSLKTVVASFNKMSFLRQRTLVSKGNVSLTCPLRKFCPDEVEEELKKILENALKNVDYEPSKAALMSKRLSETVRNKLKTMKFPRYKFVAIVTISSRDDQCMFVGSRCLWNTSSDCSATAEYRSDRLIAVATVFAVFKE